MRPSCRATGPRSAATILLAILMLASPDRLFGQVDVHELNRRLGPGVNMGNMFEAPSEQAWGNPWQSGYFKLIARQGFRHVRLPVRWEPRERSQAEPPYTIEPAFMERIRHVVDEALAEGLLVVLNMHHHEALYADPDGQRERFLRQWRQIAEAFRSYPDTLLFELLNEPHGALTAEKWNALLTDGLREIRASNPTRAVLIGTAEWGGRGGLSKLRLPEDPHLILTMHYYEPFPFTHQGAGWAGPKAGTWLGTEWRDTDGEREAIRRSFQPLIDLRKDRGIPVHIGEFGAYEKADMNSRVRWTRYLARFFDEQGFSWAYWEFSAGFGLYDPKTRAWRTGLLDALLRDPLPPPAAGIPAP
jgi:endoglucanase